MAEQLVLQRLLTRTAELLVRRTILSASERKELKEKQSRARIYQSNLKNSNKR